jgi:putative serine protease PepD
MAEDDDTAPINRLVVRGSDVDVLQEADPEIVRPEPGMIGLPDPGAPSRPTYTPADHAVPTADPFVPPPEDAEEPSPAWPPSDGAPNWAPLPGPPHRPPRNRSLWSVALVAAAVGLVAGIGGGVAGAAIEHAVGRDPTVNLRGGTALGGSYGQTGSLAGVARKVLPSVVMIETTGEEGSGFIVSGGYIVTSNHVIAGMVPGGSLRVVFENKRTSTATVIGTDPTTDIAVLKPKVSGSLPALPLGNSGNLAVGDPVIAVGSPLGLTGTVTSGIVSALNRPVTATNGAGDSAFIGAIQTDAPINQGNSGGPLVNSAGQVIGVNSSIASIASIGGSLDGVRTASIGVGFAIPIDEVKVVAAELIGTGKATHPVIGALIDASYQGGARILPGVADGQRPVTPGGPAARAGLRPGDVIVAFDGTRITDAEDLIVAIRAEHPGDRVPITYERGSVTSTVELTLGGG